MDRRQKRKYDRKEQSSIEQVYEYEYSASDLALLKKAAAERPMFNDYPENVDFDMNTKIAALKASAFVVSLISFSGEMVVSQSCGTIIEAEENDNIILTSLNLVRQPTKANNVENKLAENLKIVVRSSDDKSYLGEIVTYDFHYNLLVLKFKSTTSLQSAKLSMMDDDIGIDRSFQLRPHRIKVKHEDPVVVVGKYFYESFDFMAAPGRFSKNRLKQYDCKELLSSSCNITRCGDGAPLINLSGEVIGIAFYKHGSTTPSLPINIAFKFWDHYKKYKELRHPSYGFEASNLYLAILPTLEKVLKGLPIISNGVLVEKVLPGSYAESAGLCKDDVITKCDGKIVKSFFELWDLMWDKVDQAVELEVARLGLSTFLSINMIVGDATPDKLNKWPRYD